MFGLAKKVITRKQLRTVKAGRSDFMHGMKENLGADSHIKKKETKELWSQLRQDSMAGGTRKGLTRKDLQKSIAKILIKAQSGEGHINKREVKDIIHATGVSQKKVFNAAAEMRHEKSANFEIGKIETQIPVNHETYYRTNHEINHGTGSFNKPNDFQQKSAAGVERTNPVLKNIPDFTTTSAPKETVSQEGNKAFNINSYLAEKKIQEEHEKLRMENSSDSKELASEKYKQDLQAAGAGAVNTFGEVRFGHNRHADVGAVKDMLAKIQGNADNYKEDGVKIDKAA